MTGEPILAINVDTAALRGEAQAATADLGNLVKAAGAVVTASEKVERKTKDTAAAFERLERQLNPTEAKLAALNRRYEQNANLIKAAGAAVGVSAERQEAALAKLNARHEEQTARLTRATTAADTMAKAQRIVSQETGLAAHQMTNLSYQLQDVAVQLAGGQNPFLILMQQGPQAAGAVGGVSRLLSLMVSPAVLATAGVVALAGGLALVASRYADIAAEQRTWEAQLKALNPQMTAAAGNMREMAKEVAAVRGVGRDAAASALGIVVKTPTINSAPLARELAGLAQDLAAVTGSEADGWAAKLAKAFGEGAAGVRKLDREITFLTATQRADIDAMERHGDRAKALEIAMGALEGRFGGAGKKMKSEFGTSLDDMARGWTDFLDKVAGTDTVKQFADAGAALFSALARSFKDRSLQEQMTAIDKTIQDIRDSSSPLDFLTFGKEEERRQERINALLVERAALLDRIQANAQTPPPGTPTGGTSPPSGSVAPFTDDEERRYEDARRAVDRLAESTRGVGLAREIAAAGMRAFNAELDAGGTAANANRVRLEAERGVLIEHNAALRTLAQSQDLETDAAQRAADAAGQGEAAARAVAAANAIAAAASRSAAEASMERAKQAQLEASAVATVAGETIADLDRQIAANDRMAAALKAGGAAVAAATREEYRLTMQRKLGAAAVGELSEVMTKYDKLIQSQVGLDLAGDVGRQTQEWQKQLEVLEERNRLLAVQAGGGQAGLRAGAKLADYDVSVRIDEQVMAKQRELEALQKKNIQVDIDGEVRRYRAGLIEQARLEKTVKTQQLATSAADSLGPCVAFDGEAADAADSELGRIFQ